MCCLRQALMDKSFFLSLPCAMRKPQIHVSSWKAVLPSTRVMDQSLRVWMWVFAGPCNPTAISHTKLVSHRPDRAAGIGDLSNWQGWDGWVWSILATGTACGVLLPADPRLWAGKGCLGKCFKGCVWTFIHEALRVGGGPMPGRLMLLLGRAGTGSFGGPWSLGLGSSPVCCNLHQLPQSKPAQVPTAASRCLNPLFLRSLEPFEFPEVFSFMKQHKPYFSLKPGENTPWYVEWKQDQPFFWAGQVKWHGPSCVFFPVNSSLWSHVPAHQVSVVSGFFLSAVKDLNQPGKFKLFFWEHPLPIQKTRGMRNSVKRKYTKCLILGVKQ